MMFALYRMMVSLMPVPPPGASIDLPFGFHYIQQIFRLANGMLSGAAITGGLILARLAWHRRWDRRQPGEWLLIALAVSTVVVIIVRMAFMAVVTRHDFWGLGSILVYELVWLVTPAAYLVAGLATKGAVAWRRVILVLAALYVPIAIAPAIYGLNAWIGYQPALNQLSRWLMSVYPLVLPFLCLGVVIVPLVRDSLRRVRRGWLHRLGIIVLMAQWGVTILQGVWLRLVF